MPTLAIATASAGAIAVASALSACGGHSSGSPSSGCDPNCGGDDASHPGDGGAPSSDGGSTSDAQVDSSVPADGASSGDGSSANDAGGDGGGNALAATFFSMTVHTGGTANLPSVPIGGVRLWDTTATWPTLNPDSGVYDWTELDGWLSEAKDAGLDVLFTFGRTPTWASLRPTESCAYGNQPGCAAPPSDVGTTDQILKNFVTALVNHSVGSTTAHIKYYEIWNEPDISGTWSGTPAQLVRMGKDIDTIVHQLDSNALVVGPAASTGNTSGIHFLPAYYEEGGAPYQDIVGMHAYVYSGSSFANVPEGIVTIIDQLQKLMTANGIGDKTIFFTEGSWGKDTTMTSDEQVAYLARDYLLMWMNGIGRFYWYAWDNTEWGTLSEAGAALPPGTAYGLLEKWLIGSTHGATPCATASDSTVSCDLILAGGDAAQILWNATASKSEPVGASFAHYQTLDNATVNPITGGMVTAGIKPILVTK
jgi:hypothetical protein